MVITSQYIQISNCYVVQLKLMFYQLHLSFLKSNYNIVDISWKEFAKLCKINRREIKK